MTPASAASRSSTAWLRCPSMKTAVMRRPDLPDQRRDLRGGGLRAGGDALRREDAHPVGARRNSRRRRGW